MFVSEFLAGGCAFSEKHDLKKSTVFGSPFLAKALIVYRKHDQKSRGIRIGSPRRGSCCLENSERKEALVFGLLFLAGAFVFWES